VAATHPAGSDEGEAKHRRHDYTVEEATTEELELADRLADETARLAARLSFAIEPHEVRDRFALAAAPIAVVFERPEDPDAMPVHRSGRLDPELLPFLVDATQRARLRLGYGEERDNPYLIALVLAAFYLIEAARSDALGLRRRSGTTPKITIVPAATVSKDIQVKPGATTLRVVAPVEGDDGAELAAGIDLSW
jgi:hypothetical protein